MSLYGISFKIRTEVKTILNFRTVIFVTRKELWQIFMKTGKVSDYLNYKNAKDTATPGFPAYDSEEMAQEIAADYINNFGREIPADEEYEDDHQNGRFSDS